MVRMVNSEPFRLPGLLRYLGPVRVDEFIGRLGDHTFVPRPFIYGNKISLKLLPNFEFGYGRTVTIGGQGGDPLTPGNFIASFFGRTSTHNRRPFRTGRQSCPDRLELSMSPRSTTIWFSYGDWYSDDDPIPFQAPPRSAFRPGVYITHFPGIPKLDLHIETREYPGGEDRYGRSHKREPELLQFALSRRLYK